MSSPERSDEWDQIERLTARVVRAAVIGIPTWLIALAVLNPGYTGLPLTVGLAIATVAAITAVVIGDRRRARGPRRRWERLELALLVWVIAFIVLAVVLSAANATGVALLAIPFVGAGIAAGVAAIAAGSRR